jgi:hypothetical protein
MGSIKKEIKKELKKIPQTIPLAEVGSAGGVDFDLGVGFNPKQKPEAIVAARRSDSNDTSYLYGSVGQKGISQVGVGKNFGNQGDISAGASKQGFGIRGTVRFQAGGKVDKKTKPKKKLKDPYLERNEFKPGFYDQPSRPPVTPSTYYGTASGKTSFESPIVDPDTSMMQSTNLKDGGMTNPKSFERKSLEKKGYNDMMKNMKDKEVNELYDSVMGTFTKRFSEGGIVKGNGKVLKDRIKKTKYY